MATNRYFNNFPAQKRLGSEQDLLEDVIVESIQVMGHNVYYIPRESLDDIDMIYGETTKVKFKRAYLIEAYIANVEGFDGDGDFFSKFGLEIRDSSSFVISKRSFMRFVPTTLRRRPQEGDLVWVPTFNRMFEIKFIEEELMFFSMGKKNPYVYELRCETFRYSQEQIETGVSDIDQVAEESAFTIKLSLNASGANGSFKDGEVVYQSPDGTFANNTVSGHIKEWYKANNTMFVYSPTGEFEPSANLYGQTSNARYRVASIDDKSDFVTRDLFNNEDFDNSVELVLDLSEINPFGTP